MVVVVTLLAVMASMVSPTFRSVSGIEARTEAARLAAEIRALRGHAAVTGNTCRMVFCIEDCNAEEEGDEAPAGTVDQGSNSYWRECATGQVAAEKERSRNGERVVEPPRRETGSEESRALRAELASKSAFGDGQSATGRRKLSGLRIASIWTAHQEAPYTKGTAYLYFRPSGTTESASIVLQPEGAAPDDGYTLQVSPLSGKVSVLRGALEPDAVRDGEEEE